MSCEACAEKDKAIEEHARTVGKACMIAGLLGFDARTTTEEVYKGVTEIKKIVEAAYNVYDIWNRGGMDVKMPFSKVFPELGKALRPDSAVPIIAALDKEE